MCKKLDALGSAETARPSILRPLRSRSRRHHGCKHPLEEPEEKTTLSKDHWSEVFYFEVHFSWQAQHFGHGGDRRGSDFVTGAVNRDFWTCGSCRFRGRFSAL